MAIMRNFSYRDGERTIGFKVGGLACRGETTIAKIESKRFPSGILEVSIYVMDEDKSATIWKALTVTTIGVYVEEYDWKKIISCKSDK